MARPASAFVLVTLIAAAAAPSALADPGPAAVCVVSLAPAIAEPWVEMLGRYRVDARSVGAMGLVPGDLTGCGVTLVTSDTALLWPTTPDLARRLVERPVVAVGAAIRPLLETAAADLARGLVRTEAARGIVATSAFEPALAGPIAVPGAPDVSLYRSDVELLGLGTRGLDPRVEALALADRDSSVVAMFRVGQLLGWGFSGPVDDLTAAGRSLLVNLASFALGPEAAVRPPADAGRGGRPDTTVATEPAGPSAGADELASRLLVPKARAAPAPALVFHDTFGGAPESPRGLAGSVHLLVFWATWCGPCRKDMPELEQLVVEMARHGVKVVAVSIDDRPDRVRDFMAQAGYRIPTVVAGPGAEQAFGLRGVPSSALVDRRGRIRATLGSASRFRARGGIEAAALLRSGA